MRKQNLDHLLERLLQDNPKALLHSGSTQKAAIRGADLTRHLLDLANQEKLPTTAVLLDEIVENKSLEDLQKACIDHKPLAH